MSEKMERRHLNAEVRIDSDDEGAVISGQFAPFDSRTNILGLFEEEINPGAFSDSIENDDIRALFNHDPNMILGRNKAGTLELREEEDGGYMRNELPDNTTGHNVRESIERGDITGQSFAFMVKAEEWIEREDDIPLRKIEEAQLLDVSPVTYPAYKDTDISTAQKRMAEHGINQDEEEEREEYTCECLECDNVVETDEHCRDIECPECGGEMRRKDRPGPGQKSEKKAKAMKRRIEICEKGLELQNQ